MHFDTARAQDTYCLESLGAEHSAEPTLAGGVTSIVQEAGHSAQVLSGGAHCQHRWPLSGGIPVRCARLSIDTVPVFTGPFASHRIPDDLLAFPGGGAPKFQGFALPDFHILVPDVDPNLAVRSSMDHDPVPSGIFKHGGKAATEIAPGKPADRPRLDADTLDLCTGGPGWDQSAAQGRGHEGKQVVRVKPVNSFVLHPVKKQGRPQTMASHPILVTRRGKNGNAAPA